MNELKPEDVMMALECCACGDCADDKCPLFDWGDLNDECKDKLIANSLALLRDQFVDLDKKDAEIERWKAEYDSFEEINEMWVEENNRLKEAIKIARAEAITEFAERLIKNCDAPHWCVWMSEIDDMAKEMKGEEDGNLDL